MTDVPSSYSGQSLKAVRVNAGETALEFYTPSGGGTWGSITGTLSDQTDLQSALDLKAPLTSPTFATSITGSYLTASRILIADASKNIISADTATYPSQNEDGAINIAAEHLIGQVSSANYLSGYLADIHFIDGQALTPSSFGETDTTTGVWQPKAYSGTYGTNGFFLPFSDNTSTTTLGYDAAGSNDWTLNNFSVTAGVGNDSLVDTPTPYGTDTGVGGEVRGNYATLNPLDNQLTLANGNLQFDRATTSWRSTRATVGITSGKWYWEVTPTAVTGTLYCMVGVALNSATLADYFAASSTGWAYSAHDGGKYNNATYGAYGNTFTTNDVIGIAFDADNGEIKFYKNGTVQNSGTAAYTGLTSGPYIPAVSLYGTATAYINFGQRPFAYTAPSGFKALCTQNLPTPTIGATATTRADDYFNTVLYTGTGASLSVTGVGFQPDFTWIKERNGAADHGIYDAVRGTTKQLESNTTTDETTEATGLTAFGSDGFTVGALAQLNTSTDTYVAWNWKESTTSKFDIVTYTGNGAARTISHNLGVVPNMIIVKARTTASTDQGWPIYHSADTANPETDYLLLNTTAATADLDTVWNDTVPTSSVFSVGTNALVNANNDTYVAYLFASVAGYSAFGSYTGNGSADGPFVYTGFRPAFVLVKNSSSALGVSWQMRDNRRVGYNPSNAVLYPNLSNAEYSTAGNFETDFLSNGFKIRNATDAGTNASGDTYIYAAFAEVPAKFSLAR